MVPRDVFDDDPLLVRVIYFTFYTLHLSNPQSHHGKFISPPHTHTQSCMKTDEAVNHVLVNTL